MILKYNFMKIISEKIWDIRFIKTQSGCPYLWRESLDLGMIGL